MNVQVYNRITSVPYLVKKINTISTEAYKKINYTNDCKWRSPFYMAVCIEMEIVDREIPVLGIKIFTNVEIYIKN